MLTVLQRSKHPAFGIFRKSGYAESMIWFIALILLFFMDNANPSTSFCIFKLMGFKSCPGCGIGHSIHYALHGNINASLKEHLLGIPATVIILYYICKPYISFNPQKRNHDSTTNADDVAGHSAG